MQNKIPKFSRFSRPSEQVFFTQL